MNGRKRLAKASICAAAVMGSLVAAPAASAQLDEVDTRELRRGVTVNGLLGHERAFQSIANANGGTRASGTPGYDASAAYVKARLERAGYEVTEQEFTFPFFRELAPATLAQVTPTPTEYAPDVPTYSGSGDVTGPIVPSGGIQVPPPATPGVTAGCAPGDFTPAPAEPAIALVQRGTCTFEIKVTNAQAAGYDAVVLFNEGQPGREGPLESVTLGRPFDIPVVGVDFATGAALYAAAQAGATTVRVTTATEADPARRTTNIIADTPGGDESETVVVGAHLDSVVEGPGINDNGSGSAAILEIAEEMAELEVEPRRQVRFAFWGAEELGLLGSEHYVASLGAVGIPDIYANLNFDMVGSPNYVRFVYDGDNSAFPVGPTAAEGPAGSGQIEALFTRYFAGRGLASEPTEFSGRSDYGPFIAESIPAGGLFTGAEGIKTEEQARIYGGTAGLAYDPNYHEVGDTIRNLNLRALSEMSDAAAHAVLTLAVSRGGLYEEDGDGAEVDDLEFRGSHAQR